MSEKVDTLNLSLPLSLEKKRGESQNSNRRSLYHIVFSNTRTTSNYYVRCRGRTTMWCSYTLPFLKPSRVLHLIHKRAVFFEIVDIIKEAASRVKMRGSCVPPLTTHGGRSNTCCRCFVSQYPSTFQKLRSVGGDFESTCTVVNMDGCVVVRSGGIGTCVVVLF